jgi:hypothetical protein
VFSISSSRYVFAFHVLNVSSRSDGNRAAVDLFRSLHQEIFDDPACAALASPYPLAQGRPSKPSSNRGEKP